MPDPSPPASGPPAPPGPRPPGGPGARPVAGQDPPSGRSWPPPGSAGGDDGAAPRRRLARALVGLVVVAALVLSLVMVRRASSGDERGRGPDAVAAPDLEPATADEVEEAVAEIGDVVAEERGLDFLAPVRVELAGDGEFEDRLLEDFDEEADALAATGALLEGLGLVEPGTDVVASVRSLLGAGVVGFYDPETDELVVRGVALTPYVRTTIAHELVHALDDQHLDLDRPEYDEADDEVAFGFSALVEGNARRIESAYHGSLSRDEQQQALDEEMALGAGPGAATADVPPVLVDLIAAPYALGEPLVSELAEAGGAGAVDAAFADPPRTSEQVLDPARYATREPAVDVPHPRVPGEVVDEGVLGQLLVLLVLADEVGQDVAATAAAGWGGDRAVVWRDGERSCVTAVLVGDDVGETTEMLVAFEAWAEQHGGATVAEGPRPWAPFTMQSCSA